MNGVSLRSPHLVDSALVQRYVVQLSWRETMTKGDVAKVSVKREDPVLSSEADQEDNDHSTPRRKRKARSSVVDEASHFGNEDKDDDDYNEDEEPNATKTWVQRSKSRSNRQTRRSELSQPISPKDREPRATKPRRSTSSQTKYTSHVDQEEQQQHEEEEEEAEGKDDNEMDIYKQLIAKAMKVTVDQVNIQKAKMWLDYLDVVLKEEAEEEEQKAL